MKKFIFGMISVILFIPIMESLAELACSWIEVAKITSTKKVLVGNNEIADLQAQLEPIQTNCIGFQVDDGSYYEEDEYEDKNKLKSKTKMGFA